jgi:glutamine amidotransferase
VIVVVDYGVNNLRSVVRALTAGGHPARLTADPDLVREADHLLMPGVGHFAQAVANLRRSGLGDAVCEAARTGRPVLGICLGLQLFFATSEEAPGVEGLGLLPGHVARFRTELPVPHVGWASVHPTEAGRRHPVLAPLVHEGDPYFYHVHSYHPSGVPADVELATGHYGEEFTAVAGRANVLGVQFHPEKSQRLGIELLTRFAEWRP